MRTEMYKNTSSAPAGQDLTVHLGLDITGSDETKIAYGTPVLDAIKALQDNGQLSDNSWITSGIRAQEYDSYYADNGSLLFIGIFLGSLFLLGTAMIIYYKQISEGYEDQNRFEIMQKVGLSHREVKSSIRRQILMVFFLPASHGNASYFHGISTDPPDAPAVRHDKYQIVHRLYRRYGADLCTGIWPDLSYDRKIVLSYRRTEITTYKVSPSLAESHL